MSLSSLPQEVANLIISSLGKEDLKVLRLTSKSTLEFSTPSLFDQFILYPHAESYQQLAHVTNSASLNRFVRRLVYDALWIDHFVYELSLIRGRSRDCESTDLQRSYYDQEINLNILSDSEQNDTFGSGKLKALLHGLPNLESVEIRCRSHYDIHNLCCTDKYPPFYAFRSQRFADAIGVPASDRRRSRALRTAMTVEVSWHDHAMLAAAGSLPNNLKILTICGDLKKLLRNSEWSLIPGFESKLGGLESLSIEDVNIEFTDDSPNPLVGILRIATNLKYLSIRLRRNYDWQAPGTRARRCRVGELRSDFQHTSDQISTAAGLIRSSKLHELHLSGLNCEPRELQAILSRCSVSLRVLNLTDMVICSVYRNPLKDVSSVSPYEGTRPRSCWVSMFKWIQSNLDLHHINLSGYFRNQGLQQWQFPPNIKRGLRIDLERFIVSGGECPIEHFAIEPGFFDLHCPEDKPHVPEILSLSMYRGDESFNTRYEEIESESDGETCYCEMLDDEWDLFS